MQLSIIIVNFRTDELTFSCIKSLHEHLGNLEYEIILIDNAPIESKETYFKGLFPELIYVATEKNIGFGKANNLGISISKGRYILLLNSDTLVIDDSIQSCYFYMETDTTEEIGLLGCKLMNFDLTFQPSFYPFKKNTIINYLLSNNWILNKTFGVSKRFREVEKIIEVGDVSGAFMFLRRKVIDELCAFDPDFFLYCEETEWCRERISKRYKIVYYPVAAIVHLGGKSAPKEPMQIQSKISLALLWYKKGWVNYLLYLFTSYLNVLSHIFLLPFIKKKSKKFIIKDFKTSIKIIPYIFTDVIKYKRDWGSRKEPLVYKGARKIFFGE